MNPFLATDGYKTGHHLMYPQGTETVYSNFTPRSNKYAPEGCDHVVSFGQQMVVRHLREEFKKNFFEKDKVEVCDEIRREYSMYLDTDYDVSHIEALHDLGYLPLKIKALKEGTKVPMGVPVLTIRNTKSEFYWLTNFLETWISNMLWKPITSATLADQFKKNLILACERTNPEAMEFVEWQGHDFSMRGLDSIWATMSSGLGHAASFNGSDSLPVIHGARKFYDEKGFVVGSVNATEHSVMCVGTGFYIMKDGLTWEKYGEAEKSVFIDLLKKFPTGVLSIVSDTWDLWKVIMEYLSDPVIKALILARDGKVVIRPDSGDPVDIVCGITNYRKEQGSEIRDTDFGNMFDTRLFEVDLNNPNDEGEYNYESPHAKGVVELLWDIFGGTESSTGYKVLDSHIGCIYGDSINFERQEQILTRLEAKGFASTNVVLGVGSFMYQFNTRDTFGFAMKATYAEVQLNYESMMRAREAAKHSDEPHIWTSTRVPLEIFKDPITDDGTKKSAKGLLHVGRVEGEYVLTDQVDWDAEGQGELQTIFNDDQFWNETTLTEVRAELKIPLEQVAA